MKQALLKAWVKKWGPIQAARISMVSCGYRRIAYDAVPYTIRLDAKKRRVVTVPSGEAKPKYAVPEYAIIELYDLCAREKRVVLEGRKVREDNIDKILGQLRVTEAGLEVTPAAMPASWDLHKYGRMARAPETGGNIDF